MDAAAIPAVAKAELRDELSAFGRLIAEHAKKSAAANKARSITAARDAADLVRPPPLSCASESLPFVLQDEALPQPPAATHASLILRGSRRAKPCLLWSAGWAFRCCTLESWSLCTVLTARILVAEGR